MENNKADEQSKKGIGETISSSLKELKDTVIAFINSPRALWGINIPYIIEGLCYFGILTILGKFNSENVGLADLHAGWVYSFVTGGITFAMLIMGGYSDKLGIRTSLILAFFVMMVGRALVALSGSIPMGTGFASPMFFLMALGLLLMVSGYGLYQPAAYAGVKRYTNPKTAAMGYAVIYALMNFGAFFSGFISPFTRRHFETIFPPNGLPAVFWVYTLLTLTAIVVTILILTKKTDEKAVERVALETEEMNKENTEEIKEEVKAETPIEKVKISNIPFIGYIVLTLFLIVTTVAIASGKLTVPAFVSYINYILLAGASITAMWEFLRHRPEHPFRDKRFLFFIFALMPVQTLFAHNWLTLPYYLDRAFQGSVVSEYFEFFANLNPILIFVLAPIVAGLTARANVYRMMIIGTLVMALPTFLLAFGPNMYLFLAYILIMSVGEAMWQPRFLQWIAEIAPKGKTGAYMGIGQMPWFLTKVFTGMYSGYFVANHIPMADSGMPLKTESMWLIYAFIAMVSPVVLIIAKGWMSKGMKQKSA